VDDSRNLVYTSHWSSGDLSVRRLNPDGSIGEVVFAQKFKYGSQVVPGQQETAHTHDAYPRENGRVGKPNTGS